LFLGLYYFRPKSSKSWFSHYWKKTSLEGHFRFCDQFLLQFPYLILFLHLFLAKNTVKTTKKWVFTLPTKNEFSAWKIKKMIFFSKNEGHFCFCDQFLLQFPYLTLFIDLFLDKNTKKTTKKWVPLYRQKTSFWPEKSKK